MRRAFLLFLICNSFVFANRGNIYDYDPGPPSNTKWLKLFSKTPHYRALSHAIVGGRGEKFTWEHGPIWYRGRLAKKSVKVFVLGQENETDDLITKKAFSGTSGTYLQSFLSYLGINHSYLFMNALSYPLKTDYTLVGNSKFSEEKKLENTKLKWLIHNKFSAITKHRNEMIDYMYKINKKKLSIILAVGDLGKQAILDWLVHSDIQCSLEVLQKSYCLGEGRYRDFMVVGLPSPLESDIEELERVYKKKAKLISAKVLTGKIKLFSDDGMTQELLKDYKIAQQKIPYKDFSYGTLQDLGIGNNKSLKTNESALEINLSHNCQTKLSYKTKDELNKNIQDQNHKELIKKFLKFEFKRTKSMKSFEEFKKSFPEAYSEQCLGSLPLIQGMNASEIQTLLQLIFKDYKFLRTVSTTKGPPKKMKEDDLPYEPSRDHLKSFDSGPKRFSQALTAYSDIDWNSLGVDAPINKQTLYRGKVSRKIKILIISDLVSPTDLFSGRALTGKVGQRIQSYLEHTNLDHNYFIIPSLPFADYQISKSTALGIATNDLVVQKRNTLIKEIVKYSKNIKLVLYIGPIAKTIKEHGLDEFIALEKKKKRYGGRAFYSEVIDLPVWNNRDEKQRKLEKINTSTSRLYSISKSIKGLGLKRLRKLRRSPWNGDEAIIPRNDLPLHSRWWIGSSGDISARGFELKSSGPEFNPFYLRFYPPAWLLNWRFNKHELNELEKDTVSEFLFIKDEL